jgi:hypothetical protein
MDPRFQPSASATEQVAASQRKKFGWQMYKRIERKEDGRLIYYYTFTPAEPAAHHEEVPPENPHPQQEG